MSGAWRASLRLARREVLRSRGRSALVAAMIGVPVLLITTATVLTQTVTEAHSTPVTELRRLGAADARIVPVGRVPIVQDGLGNIVTRGTSPEDDDEREWTADEIARATGGRLLPLHEGGALIRTEAGALSVRVRELDLADPLTDGLVTVTEGRAPREAGEIAVSTAVADRGLRPGTTVDLLDAGERTIVGVVRDPLALKDSTILAPPGGVLDGPPASYLLDTGGVPVSWQRVGELGGLGLSVISRAVLADPPREDQLAEEFRGGGRLSGLEFMLPALIVGCIALEVTLLAGPAFVVGARRQRRRLALLAATGGTPRDVLRMVLAQAVVLGLGSAVTGAALGVLAVVLALPLLDDLVGIELGGPAVSPVHLPLIVGVGALTALLAAFLPAVHASRQDIVAGLGGRRQHEVRFLRRGRPLVGLLLAGGGVALASTGMSASSGGETPVLLGTLSLVVGTILVMPALLGLVGRLGGRLPLSLRLAARDVARHRSRTASAMSAVMGTVIGITALAIGSSSDFAQNRRDYVPAETMGTLTVTLDTVNAPERPVVSERDARTMTDQIARQLPDRDTTLWLAAGGRVGDGYENVNPQLPGCVESVTNPCVWVGTLPNLAGYGLPSLVVDADTDAVLDHPLTDEQRAVLRDGGVLVPDAAVVSGGTTRVSTGTWENVRQTELTAAVLPELLVREGEWLRLVAGLVLTRETAGRLDLTVTPYLITASGGSTVDEERQAAVDELVQGFVPGAQVYVERGFSDSYLPLWAILAGLGGLVVLAGTLTATALAMNDARPDLATLAAVGASPGVRRRQAMAQAALTGLLGALLGVAVGAVPGLAITWPLTAPSTGGHIVSVPWSLLATVVLLVPLVAILGAGLFTRSHLPMVRRVR